MNSPSCLNAERNEAPRSIAPRPSERLLGAALTGLLGLAAPALACDDGGDGEADPDDCGDDDTPGDDGSPEVLSTVEGNRTFESLKAECDMRGGYIQIHASCSGVNSCAGFSYGDWDPGVLTEHTCAGVNGCNGLSCVVLPPDSGKTGHDVYNETLPDTGPRSCTNCHAVWGDAGADLTKFKLWLLPGSDRNETNWLEMPPEAQARIIAFGKQAQLPDGTALSNMSPYHKVYSRAEIERTVEYIRTQLQVVVSEIKVSDLP